MNVCYLFFALVAMYKTKIYIFVSLFLQNIRCPILVYDKLVLGTCLIVSDVFLKFFQLFRTQKQFLMWWKIALLHQWSKTGKSYCKLTKTCIPSHFSKNLTTSSEKQFSKIRLDGCLWGQLFFENILEWLLLKGSCEDMQYSF